MVQGLVIKLSKQKKINLMKHFRRSTTRDFRIQVKLLQKRKEELEHHHHQPPKVYLSS